MLHIQFFSKVNVCICWFIGREHELCRFSYVLDVVDLGD